MTDYEVVDRHTAKIHVNCPDCGTLIEKTETRIGYYGMRAIVTCPGCNHRMIAEPCAPGKLQLVDYEQFCKILPTTRNSF